MEMCELHEEGVGPTSALRASLLHANKLTNDRTDRLSGLRSAVYRVTSGGSRCFDGGLVALVLLNVALGLVATALRDLPPSSTTTPHQLFLSMFTAFEFGSFCIFLLEYLLRLWSCVEAPGSRGRLQWALGALALLDLGVVVVFSVDVARKMLPSDALDERTVGGLSPFSTLRVLRLLSLLRMERQCNSFRHLGSVCRAKASELFVCCFAFVTLLVFAASLMHAIEGHSEDGDLDGVPATPECDQPMQRRFQSLAACFNWAATTISTVGYGDLHPVTVEGQLVASVVGLLGVFFVALPTAILSSGFVEDMRTKAAQEAMMPPAAASQVDALQIKMDHLEGKLDSVISLLQQGRASQTN